MASDNLRGPGLKPKTPNEVRNVKKDDLMQRFSMNFRKLLEDRENVGGTPKSVTFNPETVETSFGGSQTPGRIKDTSVHLDFTHVDAKLKEAAESKEESKSKDMESKEESKSKDKDAKERIKSKDEDTKEETKSRDKNTKGTPKRIGTPNSVRKAKPQTNGHISKDRNITKPLHSIDADTSLKAKAVLKAAKSKVNNGLPNQFKPEPLKSVKPSADIKTPKKNLMNGSVRGSFQTPDKRHSFDLLKDSSYSGTPDCFNPVTFETPHSKARLSGGDTSVSGSSRDASMESDASRMTVAVRVRPFSAR